MFFAGCGAAGVDLTPFSGESLISSSTGFPLEPFGDLTGLGFLAGAGCRNEG